MPIMPDSLGFLLNDIARLMRKRFDVRARYDQALHSVEQARAAYQRAS